MFLFQGQEPLPAAGKSLGSDSVCLEKNSRSPINFISVISCTSQPFIITLPIAEQDVGSRGIVVDALVLHAKSCIPEGVDQAECFCLGKHTQSAHHVQVWIFGDATPDAFVDDDFVGFIFARKREVSLAKSSLLSCSSVEVPPCIAFRRK